MKTTEEAFKLYCKLRDVLVEDENGMSCLIGRNIIEFKHPHAWANPENGVELHIDTEEAANLLVLLEAVEKVKQKKLSSIADKLRDWDDIYNFSEWHGIWD